MSPAEALPVERMLASPAKVLCSAIWVSGRRSDEAQRNSVFHAMPAALRELIDVDVDRERQSVSLTMRLDKDTVPRLVAAYRGMHPGFEADWQYEAARLVRRGAVTRAAQYFGSQGSIILPVDGSGLRFDPVTVESRLPDATTQDWPMGDRPPGARPDVDGAGVQAALDAAFGTGESCTAAFLVLYQGQIIGERYAPGIGKDTQLESWSMGKSLTAALLGILIRDGHFGLDDPAPVAEWQAPGDPRAAIRLSDLMRMSSGLKFSGGTDRRATWEQGVPDHTLVYADAIDVFRFCTSRPAEFPPNTVGRYRNCDPLVLGSIIKQTVTEQLGEEYLTWPQRVLFDRLGIRRQVMETDAYGNFILTGYDYGTARNWARLGLLYAQDGVWNGERILPEGFVDFVRTPAPAWEQPMYGGQFWLNGTREYELPSDAYYMGGAGEQRVIIVPSHDLVVVRLGHRRGAQPARSDLNNALRRLIEAVDVSRSGAPARS